MIQRTFKPMLACKCEDISSLKWPLLATPKIDGIRCLTVTNTEIELITKIHVYGVGRSLLPIPNRHVQACLGVLNLPDLDGELVTFTDGKMDPYNTVQSKIMSVEGEPEFQYQVFDIIDSRPYWERMEFLKDSIQVKEDGSFSFFRKLLPRLLITEEQYLAYEQAMLLQGFEGVMLRSVDGLYKYGRSTPREGYLIKMKRFKDAEATVIGFEELLHNENEATVNPLGLQERSDHKDNMRRGDTLGSLRCVGHNGIEFSIGTGFDAATRHEIWSNRPRYQMRVVKYKYQPHGVKTAPRCPVFLGWRDPIDGDSELI